MNQIIWVLFVSLLLLFGPTNSEEEEVKLSLINFLGQLSNGQIDPNWGWNMSSDPCTDHWKGVSCRIRSDTGSSSVKRIILDGFNLAGNLDAISLCKAPFLSYLSLNNNNIGGEIPEEIANCHELTHLFISGNQFSGKLPDSLPELVNLKKLDVSNNNFSGQLPDFPRISGLITFLAQNNQISGAMPQFNFANLKQFNVSFNNFSGPIPDLGGHVYADSFLGNPELCGESLPKACPAPPPQKKRSKSLLSDQLLMFSGYIILGLVVVLFVAFKLIRRKKTKIEKVDIVKKGLVVDNSSSKPSSTSSEYKIRTSISEYSISSAESAMASSSMVVLSSPLAKGLRFEDLLKAPAELLGRGRHGSVYKVIFEDGITLAAKRIKEWAIPSEDFKRRMRKIDQVKHPNVLPPIAFYCSKQEKLVVYEYHQNGSLFNLLHGIKNGQAFGWGSRLNVAAIIAESLAFMHDGLQEDGIGHGNLKSSNILMNKNMDPCISEYGLMVVDNQNQSLAHGNTYKAMDYNRSPAYSIFEVDVYGFGVILLELLTGKLVQNNGFDLAKWVHSVVGEEWTGEVFDNTLISEGANEERMVNLLQVALKCINPSPEDRPTMNQVTIMINKIKEEEERSISL